MIGLNSLLAATLVFVGSHFLLSSAALRPPLIRRFGVNGFRAIFSLVAIVALLWMLFAYRDAPFVPLWTPPEVFRWIPNILMPFAAILVVCGLFSPSPTAVGGERLLQDGIGNRASGITTVTRHPFLVGVALWAIGHLTVNGDLASLILMGGILVLAIGGMIHIDQRRESTLQGNWGPIRLTTSRIPFAAVLSGRAKIDWEGIGVLRPLAGVLVYAVLLHLHPFLFRASALPL